MGFRLAVSGGAENINLDEKTIQKVTFSSDSATDSNAIQDARQMTLAEGISSAPEVKAVYEAVLKELNAQM